MADKKVTIEITSDSSGFNKNLKKAGKSVNAFSKELTEARHKVILANEAIRKVEAAKFSNKLKRLAVKLKTVSKALNKVGSSAKLMAGGFAKFTKASLSSLGSLGKGFLVFSGVAVTAIGTVAKAYSSYEKALVGVGKTANIQGKELRQFGKDFKESTKHIPVATNELLGFAQKGAQLGVARKDLSKFAETIARLKVSVDGLDIDAAVLSIAGTVKLMEGSTENVDRFASVVAKLGDTFPTTESAILHSTQSIAAGISRFNVSTAEVVALATATTSVKIQAENARTQFQKAFQAIAVSIKKGGQPLKDLIKLTGKSGEELEKVYGESATDAFALFVEGLSKIKQEDLPAELEKYGLGGERAVTVLGLLANKGLPTLKQALIDARQEFKDNTKLIKESNAVFGTLGSLTFLVWKRITDLTTAVGDKLAPTFKALAKRATGFFDSLNNTKTIDMLTDGFLILIDLGGDFVEGIADIGKAIIKWFAGDGDVARQIKVIRKLFEMDKIFDVMKILFKRTLIDIEIAIGEFLSGVGKKITDFASDISTKIGDAISPEKAVEVEFSEAAEKNRLLNAIEISKQEEEISRIQKDRADFQQALSDSRTEGSREEIENAIKLLDTLEQGAKEKIKFFEEIGGLTDEDIEERNEKLKEGFESEKETKLSLAEQQIALNEELNTLIQDANKELEEENNESGVKSPLEDLTGDPEKNQEKVDANIAVQEGGFESFIKGAKNFFGVKSQIDKKASTDEVSLFDKTKGALLASQAIFGEQAGVLAQGLGLSEVAMNTGTAISNAIASVKGTTGYDYAIQVALAVGSVLTAIAPAAPLIKGARQEGGAVTGGDSFLVGERGAEIFTPQSDGDITSNDALGGGGAMEIIVTGGDEFARTLNYEIRDQKNLNTVAN